MTWANVYGVQKRKIEKIYMREFKLLKKKY